MTQPTNDTLEILARLSCPGCDDGGIWDTTSCTKEGCGHWKPCPDCQGTGRLAWELTEECSDWKRYLAKERARGEITGRANPPETIILQWHKEDGCKDGCQGTGRVLKQGAELLYGVEAALGRTGTYGYGFHRDSSIHSYTIYSGKLLTFHNPDRLTAATQALQAAVDTPRINFPDTSRV